MTAELMQYGGVRGSSADDPSGAKRAQAAHDAGAVEPVDHRPVHHAMLEFRVHADEQQTRELVDAIAETLARHPLVLSPVAVSVSA